MYLTTDQKNKIPQPSSEATTSHHPDVLTLILLSERRAGEAWEPSNEVMFFAENFTSVILRITFSFHLFYYCYVSPSLRFEGLIG